MTEGKFKQGATSALPAVFLWVMILSKGRDTHSITHALTHSPSISNSLTRPISLLLSLTHSLTNSLTHPRSLTHPLNISHSPTHPASFTHSITHSHPHSLVASTCTLVIHVNRGNIWHNPWTSPWFPGRGWVFGWVSGFGGGLICAEQSWQTNHSWIWAGRPQLNLSADKLSEHNSSLCHRKIRCRQI